LKWSKAHTTFAKIGLIAKQNCLFSCRNPISRTPNSICVLILTRTKSVLNSNSKILYLYCGCVHIQSVCFNARRVCGYIRKKYIYVDANFCFIKFFVFWRRAKRSTLYSTAGPPNASKKNRGPLKLLYTLHQDYNMVTSVYVFSNILHI